MVENKPVQTQQGWQMRDDHIGLGRDTLAVFKLSNNRPFGRAAPGSNFQDAHAHKLDGFLEFVLHGGYSDGDETATMASPT